MNINSAFPSSYLKAADLRGGRVTVTIDSVAMENIGEDSKPVVYFQGKERGLALNKTNANMIAEIAGTEETDDWAGVRIVLYSTKTDYQGRRVDAIRVDYPQQNGKGQQPQRQSKQAVPPPSDADQPADDDVPW